MGRKALLGHKVRQLRRRKGLTQVELAEQLGISPSYMNLIEHNQRAVTPVLRKQLARALGEALALPGADDDEARLVTELTEVFGDRLFQAHEVPAAELRDLAG